MDRKKLKRQKTSGPSRPRFATKLESGYEDSGMVMTLSYPRTSPSDPTVPKLELYCKLRRGKPRGGSSDGPAGLTNSTNSGPSTRHTIYPVRLVDISVLLSLYDRRIAVPVGEFGFLARFTCGRILGSLQ